MEKLYKFKQIFLIELVNRGHDFGYQNFSAKQIKSLIKLCVKLKKILHKKENFWSFRYCPRKIVQEKNFHGKIKYPQ